MHAHPARAAGLGQAQEGEDVLLVAVHAARRQQAEHMQHTIAGFRRGDSGVQLRVGGEAAVLDGGVDAGQVLVDDAAGADVHVADFGIAHLAVGQADETAFGVNQGVRALGQQGAPGRQFGQRDGIVRAFGAVTPAVKDQQHHRFRLRHAPLPGPLRAEMPTN